MVIGHGPDQQVLRVRPTPTTPVMTFILLCKALANFGLYTLILFVGVLLTWFPNIDWDKNPGSR